jgi:5-methylcytosine-specific restriction enzyme subunit McrC
MVGANPGAWAESVRSIPIRNVWHMLVYAWDMRRWQDIDKFESEMSPDLLGLLAQVLVESTRTLLKHQLGREYVKKTSEVKGIKGRINFTPSLKFIGNKENKLVCEFNVLDIDTLRNQIIKSTLEQLSRGDRLRGVATNQITNLGHDFKSLIRDMEGVQSLELSNSSFSRVRLGRNDRYYALPLQICSLIHQLRMPTEDEGASALAKLLRDEIAFALLFEKFVRNFYRHHVEAKFEVKREGLRWPGQEGNPLMPRMITDISIISRTHPRNRFIIDTKYYSEALVSNQGGKPKFRSEHLYQMYAYLRTQENGIEEYRHARGMLLYPTVDRHLDEEADIQGHNIRVSTIDLSDSWEAIEARLLSFLDPIDKIPVT